MHPKVLYNEVHQNCSTSPTSYESLLGDSIERAFAQGIQDLAGVVAYLNTAGPSAPNGEPWTSAKYRQELARLGA